MSGIHSEPWKALTRRYREHKRGALARKLPFTLTLYEWAELWAPHWGNRKGLMMCRILDMGGYEKGNVYIGTAADNELDRQVVRRWHAFWYRWSAQNIPLNL